MHCIEIHKDGTFEMSHEVCDCYECFMGNLSSCLCGKKNVIDAELEKMKGIKGKSWMMSLILMSRLI